MGIFLKKDIDTITLMKATLLARKFSNNNISTFITELIQKEYINKKEFITEEDIEVATQKLYENNKKYENDKNQYFQYLNILPEEKIYFNLLSNELKQSYFYEFIKIAREAIIL